MSRLLDLESIFKIATSDGNQGANLESTLGLLFKKISEEFKGELAGASRQHSENFIRSISKEESVDQEDLRNFGNFVYNLSLYTLKAILYRCIATEVETKSNSYMGANNDRITSLFAEKFPSYPNFKPNTTDDVIIKESVTYLLGPMGFGDQVVRPIFQKYNAQLSQDIILKISDINKEIFKSVVIPRWNNFIRKSEIKRLTSFIIDSLQRSFQEKYISSENPTPEVSQRPASPASSTQQVQQEPESLNDDPYQSEFRVDDHHVADYEYLKSLHSEGELENVVVSKIANLTTSKLEYISNWACDGFTKRLIDTSILAGDSSGRIIYEKFSNVMVAVIVCSSIAAYYNRSFQSIQELYDFFDKNNNLNADPFLFIKDAIIAYVGEEPSYYEGAFTLRNFKFFEKEVAMSTDRFVTVGNHLYLENVEALLSLFKVEISAPNPDLPHNYIATNPLVSNKHELDEIKKMKFRFRSLKNLRDKATNKAISVFHKMSGD